MGHMNLRYEAPREGEVKDEGEPAARQTLDEGLLQALQASQREGTVEIGWQYLCNLEDGLSFLGAAVERVFFAGPILGIPAGTHEGLLMVWMKEENQWVYDLALDTVEKVLLAQITSDADALREELQREGFQAAARIHNSWREHLDAVILAGQDDQKAELYRRSTRVLTDWEVELIPNSCKNKGLTWDELTDASECEAECIRRAELQRRARPLRRLSKEKSELREQPPLRLSTLKKEPGIPKREKLKAEDNTFDVQRPRDDAARLQALQVAQLEASQEEARLCRRLAELTAQDEALLMYSPLTGSTALMSSTMREEQGAKSPLSNKMPEGQTTDSSPAANCIPRQARQRPRVIRTRAASSRHPL